MEFILALPTTQRASVKRVNRRSRNSRMADRNIVNGDFDAVSIIFDFYRGSANSRQDGVLGGEIIPQIGMVPALKPPVRRLLVSEIHIPWTVAPWQLH